MYPVALADHHVHIFSPAARDWLEHSIDKRLPPFTVDELMPVLQRDRVVRAAVLSVAYFFVGPESAHASGHQKMRAENDWVASQVAMHRDQLVGFFSVNPITASAQAEIKRCADRPEFVGMKLHLANSRVNLRDAEHRDRLAATFAMANSLGMAILVHLRTHRDGYGAEDASLFAERVLPSAPDVPIQVAHMGGWGGYDQATDSALDALIRLTADHPVRQNLFFDLSAVIRGRGEYRKLAGRLRALGLTRVLFGTDWPDWTPRSYAGDLEAALELTPLELRTMLSSRAPWFV